MNRLVIGVCCTRDSASGWFCLNQKQRLSSGVGRDEVLRAKGKRECLAGPEFFESVGVGIRRTIGLNIEIVDQHVDDFVDRTVVVGARVSAGSKSIRTLSPGE